MDDIDRRHFLTASVAASGAAAVASIAPRASAGFQPGGVGGGAAQPAADRRAGPGDAHRGPCIISSGNGVPAVNRAMEMIKAGSHPLDAIVEGIAIVENDPKDNSVGYGGLPNEEGVVQLDASVMDGVLHRAGSVGCLENIKNPAAVALQVLRRTDHVMLVGAGALKFALRMGFKEENLLTEASREAWLKWRANLGKDDDWLNDDEREDLPSKKPLGWRASPIDIDAIGSGPARIDPATGVPYTTGTIHCSAVTESGHVAACTSTSGLSWKLPGRLGDSPIVGAGMYCDNAIGSAGATGRGEAVIQVCGSFYIVQQMENGLSPTEACLAAAKKIADKTKEKRLLDAQGRPNFNVSFYAARKDGAYGSASIWKGATYAVHDGSESRKLEGEFLYQPDRR
ncbi:MAG: N(4)-(beta-N-acetylglucosaminyl)-L-asparaginase [Phycisphaerales bacterium]